MLEHDPDASLPITVAFVLAPFEVFFLTPLPIIGVNVDAMFRLVEVGLALERPPPGQVETA